MTRYVIEDRVARLTLDRPGAMNAIDEATLATMEQVVEAVHDDESVKALVIAATGDAFCVGLDIDLLGRAFADHPYFAIVLRRLQAILLDLESLPVPVVAAVNGLARAGGFELLLACDVVFVGPRARIGDTHLAFGLPPGGGASVRAPRKLGDQRAKELLFSGRYMDAEEAAASGLALELADDPGARADRFAETLKPLSRPALAATKRAITETGAMPTDRGVDLELLHFMSHLENVARADEGYRAFVEKRAPKWD